MSEQSIEKKTAQDVQSAERTRSCQCFVPRTDIIENEEAILLEIDMPGVHKNAIDVTLENNQLTIEGKLKEQEPQDLNLTYSEFQKGDYYRAFTISDVIDRDRIRAKYDNGVLRLELPKSEASKARSIAIN